MRPPIREAWISETRDALLHAIAPPRAEGLAARHVRRLSVLAFLSPKIIRAIADSAAPAGMTASALTQALPHT